MKKFAERLKGLREEAGLSQYDLAKELNGQVSHAAICYYEQAKRIPKLDVVIVFAKYFGVSVGYLAGLED